MIEFPHENKLELIQVEPLTIRYLEMFLYAVLDIAAFTLVFQYLHALINKTPAKSSSSVNQYGTEYKKLLTAVLGDHRVASRLINFEHSSAGPAGIGKAEAVRRALSRLSIDRSRVN